jgi:hypothetical protein
MLFQSGVVEVGVEGEHPIELAVHPMPARLGDVGLVQHSYRRRQVGDALDVRRQVIACY